MATPSVTRSTDDVWDLSIEELSKPMTEMPRLGGPGPFVINLSTATSPIDVSPQMAAAFAPEHLYLIQRNEDRRLRYRLRLGPFTTEDAADEMLLKVREIYPCALTATAAEDDLRAIAALQPRTPVARTPVAHTAPVPAPAAAPAANPAMARAPVTAPAAVATTGPAIARAPVTAPAAGPAAVPAITRAPMTAPAVVPAPGPAIARAPVSAPAKAPAAGPAIARAPVSAPAKAPAAGPAIARAPTPAPTKAPAAAPRVVVSPAPGPAPRAPAASAPPSAVRTPPPVLAPATRPPSLETTQTIRPLTSLELEQGDESRWFVIQLATAEQPFDPDELPSLDIFNVYRLYSVAGHDQGRVRHALRLGFFTEEIAARAVASYLAGYYDNATIKRVSLAERERFGQRRVEARKDVGATGNHAVIEITNERVVRPKRSVTFNAGAPASP